MQTKTKESSAARTLFLLCWLAYAASYVTKLCYSVSMNDMISSGLFDRTFGGAMGTALFSSYGVGQLFNGWLGDKLDPRYMIATGLSVASVMDLLMAIVQNKYILLVIWCFEGIGCSMLWAPILRCVSEYLPECEREMAGTWISATIPCGTIVAYIVGGIFLDNMGYKAVFLVSSLIGAIVTIVWMIGMKKLSCYFSTYPTKRQGDTKISGGAVDLKRLVGMVISSGAGMAVLCILFNGVLKDGVTLWLPTYLTESFGLSPSAASWLMNAIPIINLAGAFVAVRINRKITKNEFVTIAIMFGISAASICALVLVGKYSVILATLLIALSTSSMLGANTMLLTFIPMFFARVGRTSTFTGFLDACSYLASAVSGILIGGISDTFGWNATVVFWAVLAALGGALALAVFPVWKKGRKIL